MCGTVTGTACKDSAVCLISTGSAASYGNSKIMNLDYKREEQAVIMQYGGGDTCPQGQTNTLKHSKNLLSSLLRQHFKAQF